MALLKKTEEHKSESFHYEVDKSLKIASATVSTPYSRSRTPAKTTAKKVTIHFKDGIFEKVSSLGTSIPNRETWRLYKEIEAEISRIEKEINLRETIKIVEEESAGKSVMGSKIAGILKKGKESDDKN